MVSELITPVILGRDFLSIHNLNFGSGNVESPAYGIISMYNDTRLKVSSKISTSPNNHSKSKSSYEENSQSILAWRARIIDNCMKTGLV